MQSKYLLEFEKPIAELDALIEELKRIGKDAGLQADAKLKGIDIEAKILELEKAKDERTRHIFSHLTPWDEVQMARHIERPYTLDYIALICEDFLELHGDRINADDAAIVGGMATFRGEQVVVIGHQKARTAKERVVRNFGSARPAGFRKALRLMKMAEKFHRPLLIFVDTPAAEANLQAEEEGISTTIAVCLREMMMIETPIIVAVIGEGGSGGALGIAVGDHIMMLEHAVYSVIPPEGCAAILWNDRNRAADAAQALKLTSRHACEFEIVDEVIAEPLGGAHRDPSAMASRLGDRFAHRLSELRQIPPEELLEKRYQKFRRMGRWLDAS